MIADSIPRNSPRVVAHSQIAPHDVLQQPDRLALYQRLNHVGKDGSNRIESLVCLADVLQAEVVEEDLLDDEDGDGLAKLGAGLHDPQTKGDDLGGKQEVNNIRVLVLLSSARFNGRLRLRTLTRAPMTPSDVNRRYSNGRVLDVVFRKG